MTTSSLGFWRPFNAMLLSSPVVCFIGALMTDYVYWCTTDPIWRDFSAWFLAFGLALAGFAALVGAIVFLRDPRTRRHPMTWVFILSSVLVFILGLINNFVHGRDGWTSVVPSGLALSAVTALLIICTNWIGLSLTYRKTAGEFDQ